MRLSVVVLAFVGLAACGEFDHGVVGPPTIIDRGPPALSSLTTVVVEFHAVGQAASFQCSLDAAPLPTCESPLELAVTDGAHQLAIHAIGPDGGEGPPAALAFATDATPPDTTITSAPAAASTTATATFAFTSADGMTFECAVDTGGFQGCTSPATVNRPDGPHEFKVRAIDKAGNVDPSPASHAWRITTVPPQTCGNSTAE